MERVDCDMSFDELGLDSVALVTLTEEVGRWLGVDVDPLSPYDHVTIVEFADFLSVLQGA
jgi:acyl carrier protein